MFHEVGLRCAETSFDHPIAQYIWSTKYQYQSAGRQVDQWVGDTWQRVAEGLAKVEAEANRPHFANLFYEAMEGFTLIPAGRILAGCGTKRNVTLSNTFVMQEIPDSVEGIMDTARQAALTMQMGGGLGYDFSSLRPKGTLVVGLDCPAAGPLAAMDIYDSVCRMVVTGMGRGAMMATMRCDHPDIEDFINAKSDPSRFRNFNLSVLISDAFMEAVQHDDMWALTWNGTAIREIRARALWHMIMQRNYEAAEPGVLFIDRINARNPLNYIEKISSTNSCAEQPLPPNGTCPLTSINLARLVRAPFEKHARIDLNEIRRLAGVAVRMLDNALDVSKFAVPEQEEEAKNKRRIGIGVTGVADALIMLGIRYGSVEAAETLSSWMEAIQNAAYLASAELAAERGTFPLYDAARHLRNPMIARLQPETRAAIEQHGLRNGVLTTVAPTGTISMFAGNVSSGIEPVFANSYKRNVTNQDGTKSTELVEDYAVWLFRRLFGFEAELSDAFVTSMELRPEEHVLMQSAAQNWVDSGISKTVNCPEDISFEAFQNVYLAAYNSGCKGCTTFRPNAVTGSVLFV